MKLSQKALIVLPTGHKGGAESVAFSLARQIVRGGGRVTIYVMSRGMQPAVAELSEEAGIAVVTRSFKSEKSSLVSAFWSIFRISRTQDFDLVYSTHLHVNAMLGLMRRCGFLRCRRLVARESTVIFERYHGIPRRIFKCLYWVGYGSQDLLICQTPEMWQSLVEALGYEPVRTQAVLSNPIDLRRIQRLSRANPPLSVEGRQKVMVACGRLVRVKGFDTLIEAFARVCDDHPAYHLNIVGEGPDKARLVALVASYEIGTRVSFLGRLENPMPIFFGADVGVISSFKEGFPNVLLEMMACSVKRIVSTPCTAAIREIPHVRVSDESNIDSLAVALDGAMGDSSDHASQYLQYIEQQHSLVLYTAMVSNDYQQSS